MLVRLLCNFLVPFIKALRIPLSAERQADDSQWEAVMPCFEVVSDEV
jgi:hypothetical protein